MRIACGCPHPARAWKWNTTVWQRIYDNILSDAFELRRLDLLTNGFLRIIVLAIITAVFDVVIVVLLSLPMSEPRSQ